MPNVKLRHQAIAFLFCLAFFGRTFSQNQSTSWRFVSQQADTFIQNKLHTLHIPGLSLGQRRVGHTGGAPGFSSSVTRFLDKKLTVIVLTNTYHPDFNVQKLSNEIAAFYF